MLNLKNLLIVTTISLLASNVGINHHKLSSNLQQANPETIICNKSYQSLNNSTILNNKDSSDNYHIYDINNIKTNNSLFPFINQLTVNNKGELDFDSKQIPDSISENWNNAVAQDIKNEQIVSATEGTKILQKQNLSKIVTSAYTSSSTDLHWTLLQFGGANPHIQLPAGEGDVSLIPDFQDLSESLGFYNISQSHPGNSKFLCSGFAKNFISKSSLKNDKTFDDNQYKQIMYNIIDYKTNIEVLLKNSSVTNNSKDYSVRYLLDNEQNLISVSYYQYDKSNLNINANLNINHTFNKETPASGEEFGISAITMFKWNDYADSWENFIFLYPSFTADKTSEINYTVAHKDYKVKNTELSFHTNVILNKPEGSKQPIWKIDVEPEPSKFAVQGLLLWMYMWHDEQNVYEGFQATSQSHNFDIGASFSVNIKQWIINNFMNN